MRKACPKASFTIEAYDTFLETKDKKLMALVCKVLAKTVPKLNEQAADKDDETSMYDFCDAGTVFASSNKDVVLEVAKYMQKQIGNPLEDMITRLEKELKKK